MISLEKAFSLKGKIIVKFLFDNNESFQHYFFTLLHFAKTFELPSTKEALLSF
jgi:hypothetical protein